MYSTTLTTLFIETFQNPLKPMNALTVLATHAINGSTAMIYLYECRSVDVIYTYK